MNTTKIIQKKLVLFLTNQNWDQWLITVETSSIELCLSVAFLGVVFIRKVSNEDERNTTGNAVDLS